MSNASLQVGDLVRIREGARKMVSKYLPHTLRSFVRAEWLGRIRLIESSLYLYRFGVRSGRTGRGQYAWFKRDELDLV